LLALAGAGVLLYWFVTNPNVSVLATTNPSTTAFIELRKAEAVEKGRSFNPRWTWVPLRRISPHLQRAVIVAEDASFYQHNGFDWEGLKEAATRNLDKGELRRGGSTITQQLAKNLYLSSDKSLFRKAREAMLTWQLEGALTKKRILELYLNVAEWGRGVYGAEAAARHHFGKSAADLTAEEAALLAAMLPSPRRYDPLRLTPYLIKRQKEILRRMGHES
jgi:monofunctional biosynthetic peptidoglycan transglycosylase